MKIEKSFELLHPREFVWNRMNDVYFVAQCLPGASIVEDLGEHRYKGRMSVKVGPMAAAFDGEVAIECQAFPQHHKQHDPAFFRSVGRTPLHSHRLADLRQVSQDAIDFTRTNSDAPNVQHAVGPAVKTR